MLSMYGSFSHLCEFHISTGYTMSIPMVSAHVYYLLCTLLSLFVSTYTVIVGTFNLHLYTLSNEIDDYMQDFLGE